MSSTDMQGTMKLTEEEKRSVKLVEKGIGNWVWGLFFFMAFIFIFNAVIRPYFDHNYHWSAPAWVLNESDLRKIIREEVQNNK